MEKDNKIKHQPQQNNDKNNEKNDKSLHEKFTSLTKKYEQMQKELLEKQAIILQQNDNLEKLKKDMNLHNEQFKELIAKKTKEANDQLIKKMKELENKSKNELEHAKKYAIKNQALELINIINQMEIACNFKLNDEKLINYQKGFKLILTMFINLLTKLNITIIKPVIGQEFDGKIMECIEVVSSINPPKKDNTIVEIVNNGYKLHDYILKPALVKVYKK
ncbi:nucleotide exchange factor GrpE [bacterium]|nr:nucleotide exchange factor GrpE [bacterium]